jgi:glycosyltransferase involved in cell wall biosynthesis
MSARTSESPFLSIITPTYRRPDRLQELLEVLANQTDLDPSEWEVVISDNCSQDRTADVVAAFRDRLPNMRYFQNAENLGPDRNIRLLYEKAAGKYAWLVPDDDLLNGDQAVATLIDKIRVCPQALTFIIVNAVTMLLSTGQVIRPRFNPIEGDVLLSDGKDILCFLADFDLIGAQRLVIRTYTLPNGFADRYFEGGLMSPLVIALSAAAQGPALIIGQPLAVFREGDTSSWRVYWPKIYFEDMPRLLLTAVEELGYSPDAVGQIIERRKGEAFRVGAVEDLIVPEYGVSETACALWLAIYCSGVVADSRSLSQRFCDAGVDGGVVGQGGMVQISVAICGGAGRRRLRALVKRNVAPGLGDPSSIMAVPARLLTCSRFAARYSVACRYLYEGEPGTGVARRAHACRRWWVAVDDDNLLRGYLAHALAFSMDRPKVGGFGGRSVERLARCRCGSTH